MEQYSNFVDDIIYVNSSTEYMGLLGKIIQNKRFVNNINPKESYGNLIIRDMAFDVSPFNESWNNFYNASVHHEGFHAWQAKRNFPQYIEKEFTILEYPNGEGLIMSKIGIDTEIEAYGNQIKHESFLKCSNDFGKQIEARLDFYRNAKVKCLFNNHKEEDNFFHGKRIHKKTKN